MNKWYLQKSPENPLLRFPDARALLVWAGREAAEASVDRVYRDREGRKTFRVRFGASDYFVKRHGGVGWREIFKNLAVLKRPVVGAADEYRALMRLQRTAIAAPEVVGYASRGWNPARRESVIVTRALQGTLSLEALCANWSTDPPEFSVRLRVIRTVASIVRELHDAGINHRDLYLCHFHIDPNTLQGDATKCYLIDLHRAQCRKKVPRRWRVKDLAALYFSAIDCGVSRRDLLRFVSLYSKQGLRELRIHEEFWLAVERRSLALYDGQSYVERDGL